MSLTKEEKPTFAEVFAVWAKIGFLSFGGPAGQIALMHRILVDEKRWVEEHKFLNALNYCMLLPGPEAQQLATYIGWLLHGWRGGIAAGLLFVFPGLVIMIALSSLYALYQDAAFLNVLFFGLKAAVLAIVLDACLRIAKRALKTNAHIGMAIASFVALFFFSLPFPLVIAAAGLFGFWNAGNLVVEPAAAPPEPTIYTLRRQLLTVILWLCVWQAPLLLFMMMPNAGAFPDIFSFFSKMALVTFGGAYAVLSYVAQMAVEQYHWLKPGEMLDGLALAETTPGPLVLVLSFTGFIAAFRDGAGLSPLFAGILGAGLTAWATFVPSFIWIFAGAPYIERIQQKPKLAAALSMITAAVTGVILNLAIWFALHVLFQRVETGQPFANGFISAPLPDWTSLDFRALAILALALVLVFRFKQGLAVVLSACAFAGAILLWVF